MTGADIIAEDFVKRNLERIYTFPGGTIAPVFDALSKRNIEIFCAYHEQGAGYAALAAARLTHKTQVVMVTSGPGVTNIATVVADAYFDSTPLVVIMGQVGTGDINSDRQVRQCGFQQVDAISLMKPISKATFSPRSPDDLSEILETAFSVTTNGRYGPVVIDLPMDVQRGKITKNFYIISHKSNKMVEPESGHIAEIAKCLVNAQKPVIFAGQGVLLSDACTELRQLSKNCDIPVVMSLLGLGAIPTDSPLAFGFAGHTGNQYAARAIYEADLLLVIGARLDVRQTGSCVDKFVPHGKVIRIDLDSSELEYPRVKSDINVCCDATLALALLNKVMESQKLPKHSNWRAYINELKTEYPLTYKSNNASIKPQEVIEVVNKLTFGQSVVAVSGVGSHQQWAARHFDFDFPRRVWLTSGGHGAMGYDLPTAIGAQIVRPDDLVVCFVGDGSLQINIQELQSVVVHNTPVKIFVLDNSRLAMVSQFQLMNWNDDPTTGHKINPDFIAIARAYGIKAYAIKRPEEIEPVSLEALSYEGPALIHCFVDYNEDVSPMLLPDQTMDKMWA